MSLVGAITVATVTAAEASGTRTLPVAVFVAVCLASGLANSLGVAAVAIGAISSAPILSSWLHATVFGLPLASGVWLITGLLPAAAFAAHRWGGRVAIAVAATALPAFLLLGLANAGGWLEVSHLTDPLLRALYSAAWAMLAAGMAPHPTRSADIRSWRRQTLTATAAGALGILAVLSLPSSPIRGVTFDEAHGRWATVQATFGPADFGRSSSYTYSQLAEYSRILAGNGSVLANESADLPPTGWVLVLKMPTHPLSVEFKHRLTDWVNRGGRLLIVADHTDLYDHAQHLNGLLTPQWGVRLRADSVYDHEGMPNRPTTPAAWRLIGRLDATGDPSIWMTGTAAAELPPNTVVLATFGQGFAEPGDYSRPNRFGPFLPRTSLPYGNQPAALAFPSGAGIVAIVLDSTPWSNFAVFREEYRRLFRGLLGALGEPLAVRGLGWLLLALPLLGITVVLSQHIVALALLAFALGLTGSVGWRVSHAGVAPMLDGRDFNLRVAVGPEATTEFLAQRVGPGERNYARIIASLGKYGLHPMANSRQGGPVRLPDARRWLLLEPSPADLPTAAEVFDHLRSGGDLTVLFAQHMATDTRVRAWILSLDLGLGTSSALAVAEDAGRMAVGSFETRRGAGLLRDSRTITIPRSDGLLKEYAADRLWQTYTIRPTRLPRTSGLFTIGFSAEQVSDTAIGDIWEGARPSSLGALRERQLGLLLTAQDSPEPWPEGLATAYAAPPAVTERLLGFLVSEDGRLKFEGTFEPPELARQENQPVPYAEAPRRYLADLRNRAIVHVERHCSPQGPRPIEEQFHQHECPVRLLGSDGLEWLVTRIDTTGSLGGIELLHERRWSGVGANLNIVFGD